jgi:hypothetical protein
MRIDPRIQARYITIEAKADRLPDACSRASHFGFPLSAIDKPSSVIRRVQLAYWDAVTSPLWQVSSGGQVIGQELLKK